MSARKLWCAQTVQCDKLILNGIPLQKEEVLVLLEGAKRASADQCQDKQVRAQESVSSGDLHVDCERRLLSLSAELHRLRDTVESYGRRLEALEPQVTIIAPMAEEPTLPELCEPPADEDDEDVEDKPPITVEKRGKRYYRTDTDTTVLRKQVMEAEDGTLILKHE